MWLDRLAGQSTASGTPPPFPNRHPSPNHRPSRTLSQSYRPSLHPRSSSTSLLLTPNDSTVSLPTTSRHVSNGAPQRSVFVRTPPGEIANPLEVLNSIIGKSTADKPIETVAEKPAELVEAIDFGNLSLEEFMTRGQESGVLLSSEAGVGTIEQCRYRMQYRGAIAD